MRIRVPIDAGVQLPPHIKKSRSTELTRHESHGHAFNDNLCFFRCLALHFNGSTHNLETEARLLKENLEEHTGQSYNKGVEVNMLATIENFFKIATNVYSPLEDKTAKVIHLSDLDYENVMRLNLYEKHFHTFQNSNHTLKNINVPTVLD